MTLAYDHANRRSEYASGTTTATYTYNGDGLRMAKTAAGTTTSFVWDAAEGLPLVLQAGTTSYVTGPGGLPLGQMLGGELSELDAVPTRLIERVAQRTPEVADDD